MNEFDTTLQEGFEALLGIPIKKKWWRLTQLPPKYGGMGLRSGLRTYGAQHLCSLAKSAKNVEKIVGGWDVDAVAKRHIGDWLDNALQENTDVAKIVNDMKSGDATRSSWRKSFDGVDSYCYSLAQLCELTEQKKVIELMSNKEKLHIEAHSGQHHLWVRQLPLSFKKYALTPQEWLAATRKRLMISVFPYQSHCTYCKGGWCDIKGEHAVICGGGPSRVLRHNTIRDIIAKAARDVGLNTDIEHGGGLGDQRRPGDVVIYNWREGRHLLIDVAVIGPLCSTNVPNLISGGVGAAATEYAKMKVKTYSDLDLTKYEFLPFIIETSGGMSKTAHGFCKELKSRRDSLNCNHETDDVRVYTVPDPLLVAISVELQRANSRMILERAPQSESLIMSEIVKCEKSVSIKKEKAIENLR